MQKKEYTSKHTKLKDEQGRQVHDRLRAKTFADYYEHKHWAIDQDEREYISEEPILLVNMEVGTGEISMKELDEAVRKEIQKQQHRDQTIPLRNYSNG